MTFNAQKSLITIVADEVAMGENAASLVVENLKKATAEDKKTVMWMMAAPSGFSFYASFIKAVENDEQLQKIVKNTLFFQFDDYPVGRTDSRFPITFRHLLETNFFLPLEKIVGPLKGKTLLELDGTDKDKITIADYQNKLLSVLKDPLFYVIEVKGIGMDGHWGFHGSETPLDNPPALMKVPMNTLNIQQQMLDWPQYFPNEESVPKEAITANVALFMLADMIVDLVPQKGKAFSILATYGPKEVSPLIPSSKLKEHENSYAFLTEVGSWALLEYRKSNKSSLDNSIIEKLKEIWENKSNPTLQQHNEQKMVEILSSLFK